MSYDRSAIVDTHQQTKDSITHIISSTKLISLTFRANTHDVAQMDDRGDTDTNGHWIPITLHQLRLREDFRCIRIVYIVWTVVIHAHAEIMFEKQTKHGWSQTYLKAPRCRQGGRWYLLEIVTSPLCIYLGLGQVHSSRDPIQLRMYVSPHTTTVHVQSVFICTPI